MSSAPPSFVTLQQRMRNAVAQFNALKWQMLCEMRVSVPGIIQTFDPDKQTATVKVAIRENLLDPKTLKIKPTEIPVLSDVPVVMPRAGGFALTFPVAEGDECLLVFGDNDYGAWWQSSGVQNQVDRRRHDLSDSFAIIGLWSQPNKLVNYEPDAVQLRSDDGSKVVEIRSGSINVITVDDSDITLNAQGEGKIILEAVNEIDITAPIVKINGKDFLPHTHDGVTTGGGVSGPVFP